MTSMSFPDGEFFVPINIEESDINEGVTALLTTLRPSWPRENVNLKVFR